MTEHSADDEGVLADDKTLYDALRAGGCSGPLWATLANDLGGYGWAVMSAWLTSGLIVQKCAEKGRHVILPDDMTPEDHEDLVASALLHGIALFQRSIREDSWKPELGASLRTYFLGGCLLVFSNVVRQWWRDQERQHRALVSCAQNHHLAWPVPEPVDVVTAVDALNHLIRDETERNQAIAKLLHLEYRPAEIAEILHTTPGAINAVVYRMRHRLNENIEKRTP